MRALFLSISVTLLGASAGASAVSVYFLSMAEEPLMRLLASVGSFLMAALVVIACMLLSIVRLLPKESKDDDAAR